MAVTKGFLALPVFEVVLFFLAPLPVSHCMKLRSLDVPANVSLWDPVWLNCSLDLEGDDLYSIKWYKNGEEFYRFVPKDHPPVQKYQLPGVYPNPVSEIYYQENISVQGSVYLQRTDYNTEGLYRCEASGESPRFQTVSAEKELKVFALPDEGPKITGDLPKYETGEYVNISCISGKSYPPPVLKWSINGIEAPEKYLARQPAMNDSKGLTSSQVDLLFRVESKHLKDGFLVLRCDMVVSQRYSMTAEEVITSDQKSEESEQTANKRPSGGPIISGGQERYKVGDTLHVNCTSAKSKLPTDLKWFINKYQASPELLVPPTTELYSDEEQRSTVGLKFVVKPEHFDVSGELRLKCIATSSKVIDTQSTESKAEGIHRYRPEDDPSKVGEVNRGCRCAMEFPVLLFLYILRVGC